MNATELTALVAWAMAGDDGPDEPPRIDTAANLAGAFPHTPRPSWWHEPGKCKTPADYWPQIGQREDTPGPGLSPGHPRPSIHDGPPPPVRPRVATGKGGKPVYTWPDILACTYPGDMIVDVARRLGMTSGALRMRRTLDPEGARQMDVRRGNIWA